MSQLKVYVDKNYMGEDNHPDAKYRWSSVYAHGKFEEDYNYDIVLFNQPEPIKTCSLMAKAENGKFVVVNVTSRDYIQGRCCYLDDYESLKHVNLPKTWG